MSRPGRKARCAVLALFLLTAVWELWGCSVEQVTAAPPETEYGEASENSGWEIPEYDGEPYSVIHDNVPDFSEEDFERGSFEEYSPLDSLGRCGTAFACIGTDLMPTEERGSIGQVKPSGWQTVKYDQVDGKYLYNRCHLIGYQLTAENANERNLITGTRYMNVEGMLPFENMVADYIRETGDHVLYRVTPVFEDQELVARGVLMEAESVEDRGESVEFCVFVHNVQPGIQIDYRNGDSREMEGTVSSGSGSPAESGTEGTQETEQDGETAEYVINTNTGKFHRPDCSSVSEISRENREEFVGTREELEDRGYEACKRCRP